MTRTAWPADSHQGSIARPTYLEARPHRLVYFDGIWVAFVMTAMLFEQLLRSGTALVLVAAVPVYFIVRPDRLPKAGLAVGVLGLLPAFALLSAFWSAVPQTTLYYGTEYLITVLIGIVIGVAVNANQALIGLFFAFSAHAIASMLIGGYALVGRVGSSEVELAFIGIMASKNQAADASGLGMLIASAVAAFGIAQRRYFLGLCALVVLGIDIWMVVRADSTGALLAAVFAAFAMIAMQAGRVLTMQARTLLFVTITTTLTLAFAMRTFWFDAVMGSILESAGKDATLTGRTFIWDQASRMIDANPAFGLGYNAFWNVGNPDAELIWKFAGIAEKRGFNFHNTAIEILVHLGYVGFTLFAAVASALAMLLAIRVTRRPEAFGTFAVAYLFFMGIRTPVESYGFNPFSYATALIFAILSYALRNEHRRQAAKPH
jgi:exopolysaccharide production protein ExoQ